MNKILIAGTVLSLMMLVGCSPDSNSNSKWSSNHDKPHYCQIYEGTNGCYYARDYDDGNFWFWMYIINANSASQSSESSTRNRSSPGPSYFSSGDGAWERVSTVPAGLKPTSQVLEEDKGKPVEVEEETPSIEGKTITEETTEQQAQTEESIETATSESSGESSSASGESSSSGSGSSSGDSGSSGGDSGGGGDGGGGGGD